jgi:sterol desaturase/sphingolipid hydroxylase (fatty acid hydroxylase superfamily)
MDAVRFDLQDIWISVYDSFPPAVWASFIPFILVIIQYWIVGLLHLYLDVYKWPQFLYKYKLQKTERTQIKGPMIQLLLQNVITSQITIFLPLVVLMFYTYSDSHVYGIRVEKQLPSGKEILRDFLVFLTVEEILFFYFHWILHQPMFYAKIHKIHHQFTSPVALAAIYAHPVEVLVGNILPMVLGPFLCHTHVLTYISWAVIGITVTEIHHSGYRFPWTLPFDHEPDFHDYHHEYFNRGNYGLLGNFCLYT